jgi:hypothetical protein
LTNLAASVREGNQVATKRGFVRMNDGLAAGAAA